MSQGPEAAHSLKLPYDMLERLMGLVGLAVLILLTFSQNIGRAAPGPVEAAKVPRPTGTEKIGDSGRPRCTAVKSHEIAITCDYTEAFPMETRHRIAIALDHAALSFKTTEESYMRVALTFTNGGASQITTAPAVYLEIDSAAGHNVMRRPLPSVDFRQLLPGEPHTFSARILSGSYRPDRYTINLWIPSPERSQEFEPAYSLLLCSRGVPDPSTGLNRIAEFTVEGSPQGEGSGVN